LNERLTMLVAPPETGLGVDLLITGFDTELSPLSRTWKSLGVLTRPVSSWSAHCGQDRAGCLERGPRAVPCLRRPLLRLFRLQGTHF
jgi:hypothetical protein